MRVALLVLSILISGCSVIDRLGNKPYVFPQPGEPSAELQVTSGGGVEFYMFSQHEDGCFAGRSRLKSPEAAVDIHAGRAIFMALEHQVASYSCRVLFSFTPQAGVRYVLRPAVLVDRKPGVLGIKRSTYACAVEGYRLSPEGQRQPLQAKVMELRPSSLGCLMFREAR